MFRTLDVFQTSMAMARHAGQQQALSAQNIANADTPGFKATYLQSFAETLPNNPNTMRASRPSHLHGGSFARVLSSEDKNAVEDPNGNTVTVEREMAIAVDAKRQHDRAMAIYRNALSTVRSALGKS